ncbi:hypothetical protein MLD38_013718 [Melastoma candidum]|uniref:Uncharacterized protein n=1 Tax=Melastoma candidum TaxID=119954 RepID=A0ACB9RBR5_9MYRT|nr:hypothetical protein MLD38_013718 [Melastoma candidum]
MPMAWRSSSTQNGTRLPGFRDGSNLGLLSNKQLLNDTGGLFVPVEFDRVMQGHRTEAWVQYDPTKNYLEVTITDFGENSRIEIHNLNYAVNLSQTIMNEWATIGLSATMGSFHEFHRILSREFSETDLSAQLHLREMQRFRGAALWSSISVGARPMSVILFVARPLPCGHSREGLRKSRKADDAIEFKFSWNNDKFCKGAGPRK